MAKKSARDIDRKIAEYRDAISKRIDEDQSAAYARFMEEALQSTDRRVPVFRYLSSIFEIHAHYHSSVPFKEGAWEEYLNTLSQFVVERATETTSSWDPHIAAPFMERLRAHLIGRAHHWRAEMMKRKRELLVNKERL